jgi:hypothetical protein
MTFLGFVQAMLGAYNMLVIPALRHTKVTHHATHLRQRVYLEAGYSGEGQHPNAAHLPVPGPTEG